MQVLTIDMALSQQSDPMAGSKHIMWSSAVSKSFLDFLIVVVVLCLVLGMVGVGV